MVKNTNAKVRGRSYTFRVDGEDDISFILRSMRNAPLISNTKGARFLSRNVHYWAWEISG